MLIKLALTGMKSKRRDYIVLLAGLVMSISIFYMFQTMAWNRSFTKENAVINSIQLVYAMGTVLLSVITLFYILYAGGFLISMRQREYGLFLVLGARKNKIRSLMFMESIAVGFISLAVGLGLGFGLSALVSHLMARMLEVPLTGYHVVYGPAILFTIVFFALLFGLSVFWNQLKLARMQVLDLVHGEAHTDRPWASTKRKFWLGMIGVIAILLGYVSLTFMEQLREIGLVTATLMTPLGTYLLFMVGLPPFIAKIKKRNSLRGIRAFTYGQLSFRINSLTKLLATVAMLIALGAGAIAGSMTFVNDAKLKGENYSVYDAVVHDPSSQEEALLAYPAFTDRQQYRYKLINEVLYYARESLESQPPLIRSFDGQKHRSPLVRITEPIPLEAEKSDVFVSEGQEWQQFLSTIMPDQSISSVKIIDERSFLKLPAPEQVVVLGRTDDFLANRAILSELDQLHANQNGADYSSMQWSKYQYYQYALGRNSGTSFMGFFLGIAFLAMMASSLMFKILSGASKDVKRYAMLGKLGVRRGKLSRSIYHELFLVFLFPGICGLLHVLVGMRLFSFIVDEPYFHLWIPVALFAAIYSVYYFLTVKLYQNIVLPARNKKTV